MLLRSAMRDQLEMPEMSAANPNARVFMIEEILRRAYQLHREHGGIGGYDFDDWAQAWRQLPQSGSPVEPVFARERGMELMPEEKTEGFEPCFALTD